MPHESISSRITSRIARIIFRTLAPILCRRYLSGSLCSLLSLVKSYLRSNSPQRHRDPTEVHRGELITSENILAIDGRRASQYHPVRPIHPEDSASCAHRSPSAPCTQDDAG